MLRDNAPVFVRAPAACLLAPFVDDAPAGARKAASAQVSSIGTVTLVALSTTPVKKRARGGGRFVLEVGVCVDHERADDEYAVLEAGFWRVVGNVFTADGTPWAPGVIVDGADDVTLESGPLAAVLPFEYTGAHAKSPLARAVVQLFIYDQDGMAHLHNEVTIDLTQPLSAGDEAACNDVAEAQLADVDDQDTDDDVDDQDAMRISFNLDDGVDSDDGLHVSIDLADSDADDDADDDETADADFGGADFQLLPSWAREVVADTVSNFMYDMCAQQARCGTVSGCCACALTMDNDHKSIETWLECAEHIPF